MYPFKISARIQHHLECKNKNKKYGLSFKFQNFESFDFICEYVMR
jgi:hypothetical protein